VCPESRIGEAISALIYLDKYGKVSAVKIITRRWDAQG